MVMSYKIISPSPVVEGGTGAQTLTNHGVLLGQGTSAIVATAAGTTGQVLTGVTGSDPVWASPAASSISITGDSGGAQVGSSFTFTGGTSGAVFTGAAGTFTESFNFLALPDSTTTAGYVGIAGFKTFWAGPNNLGSGCLFIGKNSGNTTLTGNTNIAIGTQTLQSLTNGASNCVIGHQAAVSTNSGSFNTVMGHNSCLNLSSGNRNTAIGAFTLQNGNTGNGLTTGSLNTAIGQTAANTGAGCNYTSSESSNICIANNGVNGESNVIRIGVNGSGAGQQNKCYIAGIDGINVGSTAKVITMASDQLGTATVTAGTGISVSTSANTITIASTATAFTWSVITANQTAAVNNGYICNKAGTLALALPASSAVGDIIEVTGINTATGWQITQAAGQQIFFGTSSTTLGATGTLTSSNIRDSIKMVCVAANTTWNVVSSIGNISIA